MRGGYDGLDAPWRETYLSPLKKGQIEPLLPPKLTMTYEYVCTACGNAWEADQRISEPALDTCPKCNQKTAKRQISGGGAFILKGGGWYSDLYSSSGSKSTTSSSTASSTASTPASSTPAASTPAAPSSSGSSGSSGGGSTSSS